MNIDDSTAVIQNILYLFNPQLLQFHCFKLALWSSNRLDWSFCIRLKKSSSGTVGASRMLSAIWEFSSVECKNDSQLNPETHEI